MSVCGGRLSSSTCYYIPRDGPKSQYQEYIGMLPPSEHPEVFGQHFNADIGSQIAEAKMLFDTLLSLQPQVTGPTAAGPSREDKVGGAREKVGSSGGGVRVLPHTNSLSRRCWSSWPTCAASSRRLSTTRAPGR